jgi:N-acetylmuramoyl-L-alanine amidase
MPTHKVIQGECITSIASKFGLTPQTILDHNTNADLKRERPNANILFPGDEIFIPNIRIEKHSGDTGRIHRFVLKDIVTKRLRLALEDAEGNRLSNCTYEMQIGDRMERGKTTANGMIEKDIPVALEEATLKIDVDDQKHVWELKIGHLNPAASSPDEGASGIQARLHNLGFYDGPIDGGLGPKTEEAIRTFQAMNPPLEVDGICKGATLEKLITLHGC